MRITFSEMRAFFTIGKGFDNHDITSLEIPWIQSILKGGFFSKIETLLKPLIMGSMANTASNPGGAGMHRLDSDFIKCYTILPENKPIYQSIEL